MARVSQSPEQRETGRGPPGRQLRYCDTGDVPPSVPGLRVAMLGELLGITVWQAVEAGRPESLSRDRAGADIFVR